MIKLIKCLLMAAALLSGAPGVLAAQPPVTPQASTEAKALLKYLYKISGRNILTGQHNAPLQGSSRLIGMYKQVGAYPALFGQDFGFSEAGSWDGINFRQATVDDAIRRYQEGFLITLMWHAVVPTQDEPGTFEDSVQAKLSDEQWRELLTPGSALHERWKTQVDVIAWHLRQLRDAGVPVLWRPYHEMNGEWFWWGGRTGPEGYAALYRMLFDRLANYHQLTNLIWVFNTNEVKPSVGAHSDFYPGHDVVDALATDVYTGRYDDANYQAMLSLAEGRPIGLGEIGSFPGPEVIAAQKQWAWFMSWRDPDNFFWNDKDTLEALFNHPRAITLDELPWVKMGRKVRRHSPMIR